MCEAFGEICAMALRLGVRDIKAIEGCWEYDVDGRWWVAVNGHNAETSCSKSGISVPPFHAYVMFNGWPAGIIGPGGGEFAAGDAANEQTFIAAPKAVAPDVTI